jgi:hypothetical protein
MNTSLCDVLEDGETFMTRFRVLPFGHDPIARRYLLTRRSDWSIFKPPNRHVLNGIPIFFFVYILNIYLSIHRYIYSNETVFFFFF